MVKLDGEGGIADARNKALAGMVGLGSVDVEALAPRDGLGARAGAVEYGPVVDGDLAEAVMVLAVHGRRGVGV